MYKILIATHGKMCEGMLDTIHLFSADTDMVQVIPFYTDQIDGDKLLDTYMQSVQSEDVVVALSDIPGGSVNQKLLRYVADNIHVISGVNFPLLYGLLLADEEEITKEFIREKIEESRSMIIYANDVEVENNEGDE